MKEKPIYISNLPRGIKIKSMLPVILITLFLINGVPIISGLFYLLIFLILTFILFRRNFALTQRIYVFHDKIEIRPFLYGRILQFDYEKINSPVLAFFLRESRWLNYFRITFLYENNEEIEIQLKANRSDLITILGWINQKLEIKELYQNTIDIRKNPLNVISHYSKLAYSKEQIEQMLREGGIESDEEIQRLISEYDLVLRSRIKRNYRNAYNYFTLLFVIAVLLCMGSILNDSVSSIFIFYSIIIIISYPLFIYKTRNFRKMK